MNSLCRSTWSTRIQQDEVGTVFTPFALQRVYKIIELLWFATLGSRTRFWLIAFDFRDSKTARGTAFKVMRRIYTQNQ